MQVKLLLICLLTCKISLAQYLSPVPTQFDSFITRPTIEWACYANDYLNFSNYNLNKLLYNRFVKKEIQASSPIASRTNSANYIYYTTKDTLDYERLYAGCCFDPVYDSNGNVPDFKIEPAEIDTGSSLLTSITQILYIEGGKLKSYIPWVSPNIVKVSSQQTKQLIGYSEYLSTCYNYKFDYLPKENKTNIFLGSSSRNFNMDSIVGNTRLKELYGRNLIMTLLSNFLNNKIDICPFKSDVKLKAEELENHYDSLGNFVQHKYLGNYNRVGEFKELELVQDWYYNYTENIVFNEIKALYLCAKECTNGRANKEASPVLKIVFK